MRLAIVIWEMVGQIGGIATRVNRVRDEIIRQGDTCDILFSSGIKVRDRYQIFEERRKIRGKDNWIWVDGTAPHHPDSVRETIKGLNNDYDGIMLGYFCPTETRRYPKPLFVDLVRGIDLPVIAFISDVYWKKYRHWANLISPYINEILTPIKSYGDPVLEDRLSYSLCPFPIDTKAEATEERDKRPSLIWPNQWKGPKGIKKFLSIVPQIPKSISVRMYSCGIDYYQLRKHAVYVDAIGKDHFKNHSGRGKAQYFGTVEVDEMQRQLQRAHFMCSLQGLTGNQEGYKAGTYNNVEAEALYWGCVPVLHESTKKTPLPEECYLTVADETEIPDTIKRAVKTGFVSDPHRVAKAKAFIKKHHSARKVVKQIWESLGLK